MHILIIILLTISIFMLDVLTPVGIAIYFLYLFPLFYVFLFLKRQHLVTLTSVVSMLTAWSFWLSPPGGNTSRAIMNRIIGIITFWGASFLFIALRDSLKKTQETESKLRKSYEELEQRVEYRTKELKESEHRQRQLVTQNKLILESAGEGIFGLDINGIITFVNPAAAKMLGYEPDELIGKHSHSTWHHTKKDGSTYPIAECPIYAAYTDGHIHRGSDEIFWKKDTTSFSVTYTSTPIIDNGKIVGAVVTFTDISEVKLLRGLLPICASCKKIRDDKGYWSQIEAYISEHSEALFTHGICPECGKKLYPELYDKVWGKEEK